MNVDRVVVDRRRFEAGDLPPICAVSGDPADGLVASRLSSVPPWTWILLLFGILPFLIAVWFAADRVQGQLPMAQAVVTRYHRRRYVVLSLVAIGLLALAAPVAFGGPAGLAWVAVASLLLAGVLRVRAEAGAVGGRAVDRDHVELTRVHPRFVAALRTDRPVTIG